MSARSAAPLDLEARRQLLLTRIAFERDELRRDVARLHQATSLPYLLRSIFGIRLKPDWFGSPGASLGDWVSTGLSWLRRYRLATTVLGTLFGGAAPLLRKRGRWRRLVLLAAVAGGAAYWVWRNAQTGTQRSG